MAPGSPFSCTYSGTACFRRYCYEGEFLSQYATVLSNSNTAIDYHGFPNCFESSSHLLGELSGGYGCLGFVVIAFGAAIIFTYWQVRAFMAGEKSLGIVNSFILEIYSGIHKIKSCSSEQQFLHQWAERYSRLRKRYSLVNGFGFFILPFRQGG